VTLPERLHFFVGYKLTPPCLIQAFLDREPFLIGGMIEFAFLRLKHQQHFRRVLLTFGLPGKDAIKNGFDLCLRHDLNLTFKRCRRHRQILQWRQHAFQLLALQAVEEDFGHGHPRTTNLTAFYATK